MGRRRKGEPPAYRAGPNGRARVIIGCHTYWLGKYGTPESHRKYEALLADWRAGNPHPATKIRPHKEMTIVELAAAYAAYADGYYRKGGRATSEVACIRGALRVLIATAGNCRIRDFGSRLMTQVRDAMADAKWSRSTVNHNLCRLKSMFRWGVTQEYVPGEVFGAVSAVRGFAKGRPAASGVIPPESDGVASVSDVTVEATLAFLPTVGRDMVRIQRLCAMRPEEIVAMRPCDVDTSGPVWIYKPGAGADKTNHLDTAHAKAIAVGPMAQDVLRPYLTRPPTSYCFSPREGNQWVLSRSGEYYTTASYRRMIARAADRANKAAVSDAQSRGVTVSGRLIPRWHPHQLRHSAITQVANTLGRDAAQALAGHLDSKTTGKYIDSMTQRAIEVAQQVG
jgi:integrase